MAGFAVGIVERDAIVDGPARTEAGDVLIGLPVPGPAVERVLPGPAGPARAWPGVRCPSPAWAGAGAWTLADELLRPSVIYTPAVLALLAAVEVHALAHITGGGLPGNVPRVLGDDLDAVFERARWPVPPIFAEIQRAGGGRRRRDGPGVQPRSGHGRRRASRGRGRGAGRAEAAGQDGPGGRRAGPGPPPGAFSAD